MAAAKTSKLKMLTAPALAELPWLVHGFSTRVGGISTAYRPAGDLNLGFTADDSWESVKFNRELLLDCLAASKPVPSLVTIHQTHSSIVHRVDQSHALGGESISVLEGDGLMTDTPGVVLGILTADCAPVLVADTRRRAVAAFHAGWRGTVAAIVEKGIARMREEFASMPEDLLAAVGPSIGPCCYSVGEEVRQQFIERFAYAEELLDHVPAGAAGVPSNAIRLDLPEANRRQLLAAGLSKSSITITGGCTSCDTYRFFSHRAEHGFTGRMMAVVGVRAC